MCMHALVNACTLMLPASPACLHAPAPSSSTSRTRPHADVMKFKRHPASGAPLSLKDLVKLTWHKNADGEYHCPVMNKVFTEHTHIVAVRTTGNVYCWEAVDELCVKPKSWKDLITGEQQRRRRHRRQAPRAGDAAGGVGGGG